MNKSLRRRLSAAARVQAVSGNLWWDKDEFGRQIAIYNDLPILIADYDNNGNHILDFNEACPGGGTATGTSLYVVSFGDGMVRGLQSDEIDVRDIGELDTKPVFRTRVEWYVSMVIEHPRAAARMWGIKDAAITK